MRESRTMFFFVWYLPLGSSVGADVGDAEGKTGAFVGAALAVAVGVNVGVWLGSWVGAKDGLPVGTMDAKGVGPPVGALLGKGLVG